MSITTTDEIIKVLIKKDRLFLDLHQRFGLIDYQSNANLFEEIVRTIVGQMLTIKVADVITARIHHLTAFEPTKLATCSSTDLRNCGISNAKVNAIQTFSQDYLEGKYDFSRLEALSDEEVIHYLRQIKGVGRWTAEMIALFSLGRSNIFSYDDVALKLGLLKAYPHYKTMNKPRFEQLRKKFSPYCSYASLYFYACRDAK